MSVFDKPVEPIAANYILKDKEITCDYCGESLFYERNNILLNTRGLTFFGLDWTNKNSHILICSNCSKIMWFLDLPKKK